ncbi:uncharacterized protein E0L32_009471 [Thyridium curvatum]|uniref:Uncharacterized protein n=1 Tax=Thyridium curvatum TaxID=1093900 RepID=A0A507AWB1_9PEZI|nr:uncharacterized protein E0L32_009471 [Thyridium curvatum]TPX09279.1 hypothetical protein E0L32_009471 [Thyridium curvatum]
MASPHSNGFQSSYPYQPKRRRNEKSLLEDLPDKVERAARVLWSFARGRGRRMALAFAMDALHQVRRNLTARRILSFPHLLVVLWVFVMLWGERWVFHSTVERSIRVASTRANQSLCLARAQPKEAQPHHLVLLADPQLIDPHSYPGRPWPFSSLTVTITDNYMRRAYNQLQQQLHPDTIYFLGDLFDGGREWKTAHGEFKDPEWGHRPSHEQKHAKSWKKKYGEDFWLREYARFGDIFFDPWSKSGAAAGKGQRGRRLIASLPGNHDLGFGSEIQLPVRDRFEAYFGDGNRVDVIGNHTFVSVDTVSLSADTSEDSQVTDLRKIYQPAQWFLNGVDWNKRKAVARELRFQKGETEEAQFKHRIEDLAKADFSDMPNLEGEKGQADLPTILLSHVPLYRPPGTPCGPMREHWPPTKPPKGQKEPVNPDHRNAIIVSKGYQYQNVLSDEDSRKLVNKIGNVVHAFSGDDHDYCELVHDQTQGNVKEITVKSMSMAMGVPTPGFLMVSMYNPIDGKGNPLPGAPKQTLQTHLCLLPNQLSTYSKYAGLIFVSLVLVGLRAFLVPILGLQPFALEPQSATRGGSLLPLFSKAKAEDSDGRDHHSSGASGFSAGGHHQNAYASTQSRAFSKGGGGGNGYLGAKNHHHHQHKGGKHGAGKSENRWGWGAAEDRGPKIEIRYDDDYIYDGGRWKAASRVRGRGGRNVPSSTIRAVGREFWTSAWRVAWMVVVFWGYLAYKG